jgi:hypothetical protein
MGLAAKCQDTTEGGLPHAVNKALAKDFPELFQPHVAGNDRGFELGVAMVKNLVDHRIFIPAPAAHSDFIEDKQVRILAGRDRIFRVPVAIGLAQSTQQGILAKEDRARECPHDANGEMGLAGADFA